MPFFIEIKALISLLLHNFSSDDLSHTHYLTVLAHTYEMVIIFVIIFLNKLSKCFSNIKHASVINIRIHLVDALALTIDFILFHFLGLYSGNIFPKFDSNGHSEWRKGHSCSFEKVSS